MVNLRIFSLGILTTLVGSPAMSMPPEPPPTAPVEVVGAAPQGTHLLAFKTSGVQADANAVAVFEGEPDKEGVAHRDLIIFGKRNGKFVPEVTSDKLIACSKCTQFHDDAFDINDVKVSPGQVRIVQMDGGEKPTTTIVELARESGVWHVRSASRHVVDMGRFEERTVLLPLPKSGLAADMDAQWSVPVYLNTLMVNKNSGKFWFLHDGGSPEAVWKSMDGRCGKQDCTILVQQQDGCISLVRDESSRWFSGANANHKDKKQAVFEAMNACNAAGAMNCKEVETQCRRGI
jgi:hypothetical protein